MRYNASQSFRRRKEKFRGRCRDVSTGYGQVEPQTGNLPERKAEQTLDGLSGPASLAMKDMPAIKAAYSHDSSHPVRQDLVDQDRDRHRRTAIFGLNGKGSEGDAAFKRSPSRLSRNSGFFIDENIFVYNRFDSGRLSRQGFENSKILAEGGIRRSAWSYQ
jgi:hypothetical protein